MGIKRDLRGMRFGRLFVIEEDTPYIGSRGEKLTRWKCRCDCGTYKTVRASELIRGHTISCGCAGREHRIASKKSHGKSHTRQYHIYLGMINRCCKPQNSDKYLDYGGRGITVCDEWTGSQGFEHFYEWAIKNGYENCLTLDRIDVNGNYSPENCRWITNKEQQNNKRDNVYITINNETLTMKQWSEKVGIPYNTVKQRIYKGWSYEEAIFTPVDKRFSHKRIGK